MSPIRKKITVQLPSPAKRYYRHGWQSWSLTAWQNVNRRISAPKPKILHPLQTDLHYVHESRPHGSWLGAVEMENGKYLLLGALALDAHIFLEGNTLIGKYENEAGAWFIAEGGKEEIFTRYPEKLALKFGKKRPTKSPKIWCSWYSFYEHISAHNLGIILNNLDDFSFDVFQVDDGWQRAVGDWIPNEKFSGGMDVLSAQIRRSGHTPGLWLAPFIVTPSSTLFRQHPNWLLRDHQRNLVSAGFNWGEKLYALDTSHPEVLEWLSALMQKVRKWGYDYVKLDFLYAGALSGNRYKSISREQAYRHALKTMRNALGDAYLLTCGAPIIPSLGLCDGIRIGPDVASHWDSYRDDILLSNFAIPGTRNAIRTTVNRLWLKPLIHIDPDVAYFASDKNKLTDEQAKMLQNLALVCDYKATSDIPSWLREKERFELETFLNAKKKMLAEVDFSEAMAIPEANWIEKILGNLLGFLGDIPAIIRFFRWLDEREIKLKIGSV